VPKQSHPNEENTAQRKYIVDEVAVEPTPFGGFTTYYLLDAERAGKRFRVGNGHLVLSKVQPQQLTIRITNHVLFALALDDVARQQSLEVEVIYGNTLNDVVGGVEEIATVGFVSMSYKSRYGVFHLSGYCSSEAWICFASTRCASNMGRASTSRVFNSWFWALGMSVLPSRPMNRS